MPFRKGNSWITTSQQYRVSTTVTAWQDWKAPLPVSAEPDHEKRKQMRLEKKKPVLEAFWAWVDSQHPTRNTRLAKALTYVKNRRETSMTYLEDGRCSFTNNLSENAIRPFTLGRKNWLFSDSVEGAQASAITYTMVEMAKAHNLNIYGYLSYILEQRTDESWNDEQLAELAPRSEKLQTLKIWEYICSKILQLKMSWGKFIATAGLLRPFQVLCKLKN